MPETPIPLLEVTAPLPLGSPTPSPTPTPTPTVFIQYNTGTSSPWSTVVTIGTGLTVTGGSLQATGGSGTVTSVGLTVPSWYSVSGSPVTGSGTLAVTAATGQTANRFLATPSGSTGAVSLRAIVGADLPNPSSSTLGGIQSAAAVSHQWIDSISTSGVPHLSQPAFSDISGTATVSQGGTGLGTLTSHAVLIGAGTSNVAFATVGTSGRPLIDKGSSADPSFSSTGVKIDSHFGAITTDSDGATITFDLSVTDWHTVQLGGNRTLALSNVTVGQQFTLYIQQAHTGGPYSIAAWFSGLTWIGSPYTAPLMPTTADAYLTATFKCISSGVYLGWWLGNSAS